jgi:hypothetical protein
MRIVLNRYSDAKKVDPKSDHDIFNRTTAPTNTYGIAPIEGQHPNRRAIAGAEERNMT